MSATVDADVFVNYFEQCTDSVCSMHIPGFTYPVPRISVYASIYYVMFCVHNYLLQCSNMALQ